VAKLNSFEEFKTFLATTFNQFKPSVIALQTIWNKPQNLEFILENYHPLHFRIRDKQGLNNNSGGAVGLWVENLFYFEPAESISIFIPRVFNLNLLRLKLARTNISLWAIYIVQIVLHIQTLNTLIKQKMKYIPLD